MSAIERPDPESWTVYEDQLLRVSGAILDSFALPSGKATPRDVVAVQGMVEYGKLALEPL